MRILTLGDVRPVVAQPLNLCPTDPAIISYVNRAQERLMAAGDWLGTFQVYRICINAGCLTYPRPVERLTLLDVDDCPVPIRNQWYEFLENGPGFQTNPPLNSSSSTWNTPCWGANWCGISGCLDRGQTCLYTDIRGTPKKIKVYADVAEDPAAKMIVRGYDENLNWIQTETTPGSGIWIEGEQIPITTATAISTKKFYPPGPQVILKDVTKGPVRVYSYDDTVSPISQELLAVYEPGETRPVYRKYFIPNLQQPQSSDTDQCNMTTVTALVKLRHIDAVSDADTLILQSVEAFRLACQGIRKEENQLLNEANLYWQGTLDPLTRQYRNGAIPILQQQLENYLGAGAINPVRYESSAISGAGVYNLV